MVFDGFQEIIIYLLSSLLFQFLLIVRTWYEMMYAVRCKMRPGQRCAEREEFYCLRISSYSATIHWCEMGISGGDGLVSIQGNCDPETISWKFCFCLWLVVVVAHPQTLMQGDIKCEKFTDYINNVWAGRVGPRQPAQSILGNLNQISYQIHQKVDTHCHCYVMLWLLTTRK